MIIRRVLWPIMVVLLIAVFMPRDAGAITGMGFGLRTGFVFDYDNPLLKAKDEQPNIEPKDLSMFGGHFTVLAIKMISVEVSGEYAYRDYERAYTWTDLTGEHTTGVEYQVRDYAGFATVRYKLIQKNIGVHLGGGLNVHRFTYSTKLPFEIPGFGANVEIPENGWHTGFHALAGASFGLPMMPFRVFGELRIAKINVSGDAAQEATVLAGVTLGAF